MCQATFLGDKDGILIILNGKAIDRTAIDGESLGLPRGLDGQFCRGDINLEALAQTRVRKPALLKTSI